MLAKKKKYLRQINSQKQSLQFSHICTVRQCFTKIKPNTQLFQYFLLLFLFILITPSVCLLA